jgi:hypothetical protein
VEAVSEKVEVAEWVRLGVEFVGEVVVCIGRKAISGKGVLFTVDQEILTVFVGVGTVGWKGVSRT